MELAAKKNVPINKKKLKNTLKRAKTDIDTNNISTKETFGEYLKGIDFSLI